MLLENRKARHEYTILDTYEAGLVLTGPQASLLRRHGAHWSGPYVTLFPVPTLLGLTFSYALTEQSAEILLLLHKEQISKLKAQVTQKGLTIVPLNLHYDPRGKVKCTIALAQGKKNWNKKQALKERDLERCKYL